MVKIATAGKKDAGERKTWRPTEDRVLKGDVVGKVQTGGKTDRDRLKSIRSDKTSCGGEIGSRRKEAHYPVKGGTHQGGRRSKGGETMLRIKTGRRKLFDSSRKEIQGLGRFGEQ